MDLVAQGWEMTVRGVEVLGAASEKYQPTVPYPRDPFAKALQNVAQMIAANLGTRVFYVSMGGFDMHSNQKPAHANLLTNVSEGLAAYQRDLEQMGKADGVLISASPSSGGGSARTAAAAPITGRPARCSRSAPASNLVCTAPRPA